MEKIVSAFFSACILMSGIASGQAIDLTGKIVNESGAALEGVHVILVENELETQTDAQGIYAFGGTDIIAGISRSEARACRIQGGMLAFDVPHGTQAVSVEMLDLSGRKHPASFADQFSQGNHSVDLASVFRQASAGVYVVRVRIAGNQYVFKGTSIRDMRFESSTALALPALSTLARRGGFSPDSLHCYLHGYENVVYPLDNLIADVPDITLKSGIAFEPYFFGSGTVVNLATGDSVHISMPKRLNVVIFPEGYTQQDLDNGEFDQDLETWMSQVFVLKVPAFLKQAFIIWRYDAPSNAHLTGEGTVDSYFQLPLSGSAMAGSGYEQPAAITWNALATFPFKPGFYSSTLRAINLTCSYVLFNASSGRASYSGMATSFANPDNTSQRVMVAMAQGHQHEYMHAMARLADEYYELDHGPLSDNSLLPESRYISNVVSSPACATLPWAHLLRGGQYNADVDSLYGAFGTNGRYHPTLKCLMNGSHENAMLYGGTSNNLRTDTRMCDFCAEICAFRIYERTSVLPDEATSWTTWVDTYRNPFYAQFPLDVPEVVPQQNSDGVAVFFPCTN